MQGQWKQHLLERYLGSLMHIVDRVDRSVLINVAQFSALTALASLSARHEESRHCGLSVDVLVGSV